MSRKYFDNLPAWTPAENTLLAQHYPEAAKSVVLDSLPGRTWLAVGIQAAKINVTRSRYWTPARVQVLRQHYPTHGAAYVATLLGLPLARVTKKASLLRLARVYAPKPAPAPKPPKAPRPPKLPPTPKPPKVVVTKPKPAPKPKPVVEAVPQHQPARLNNLITQKALLKKKNEKKLVHKSITVEEFKKLPLNHPGRPHYLRDGARGWDKWAQSQQAA